MDIGNDGSRVLQRQAPFSTLRLVVLATTPFIAPQSTVIARISESPTSKIEDLFAAPFVFLLHSTNVLVNSGMEQAMQYF